MAIQYRVHEFVSTRRPGCDFDPDAVHAARILGVYGKGVRYRVRFLPETLFPDQEMFVTLHDIDGPLESSKVARA